MYELFRGSSRCVGLVLAVAVVFVSTKACGESIWVEGENPTCSTAQPHSWYNSVRTDALSGGDWLANYQDQEGVVEYDVEIAEGGSYTLWVRLNPLNAKMSYRVDDANWQAIDVQGGLRGQQNIAADNKPDMRFIAWVNAGELQLEAKAYTLAFRMHSRVKNHGAIDAFCLDNSGWVPSGTQRPSARKGESAADEWFPVTADVDPLSAESVIDMSQLVDAPAGKHGFLTADGDDLRFENRAEPVKFWALGSNLGGTRRVEEMVQRAKWYRKHGVNLLRQHTTVGQVGLLQDDNTFASEPIDRYDRWFAELKKQGIYSTWSVIYPHHGAFVREGDVRHELFEALKAGTDHEPRDGVIVSNDWINLSRELQDYALEYFKALLEHENPHTGLKYKNDPALAVLEMQNESNVFFHSLSSLAKNEPALFARSVRKGFYRFVAGKYGSRTATAEAWSGWNQDDDWAGGELGVVPPYAWGSDGPAYQWKGQRQRTADFIEYLGEVQRDYYQRRYNELRAIGFQGVIVTTAWKGVGASSLANLWADDVGDMIDRHNYFGGGSGGHKITEGEVNNATHLSQPGRGLLSMGLFQLADKPFGVSEWSMTPPAPWKAEAAPLIAFYGLGLQGWDASYHFATSAQRLGNGWPGLSKYVSHTPHYMGQFPALAFAIHHDHVQQGEVVAMRRVSRQQIFSGRDELGQSLGHGTHDYKSLGDKVATPPEFLALGRVALDFDDGDSEYSDPRTLWDEENKVLRSNTGELVWRYGDRYVEVRTPKTQAIIGFAGGKTVELPAVRLEMTTPFASLIFTPLDNKPLAESSRILITAMARDKQTGAEFNEDWSRLEQVGSPPLLMEPVQATIRLAGPAPTHVRALDIYGVPTDRGPQITDHGSFYIDGTQRTYYYLIER